MKITLSDGEGGTDTIDLTDAVNSSYGLVPGPNSDEPSIALNLIGRAEQTGSISVTIGEATLPVVSVTIPQSTGRELTDVSPLLKASAGITAFVKDAGEGKVVPEVKINFDRIGNGLSETIILKNVLVSSVQYVSGGTGLEVKVQLMAAEETIQSS